MCTSVTRTYSSLADSHSERKREKERFTNKLRGGNATTHAFSCAPQSQELRLSHFIAYRIERERHTHTHILTRYDFNSLTHYLTHSVSHYSPSLLSLTAPTLTHCCSHSLLLFLVSSDYRHSHSLLLSLTHYSNLILDRITYTHTPQTHTHRHTHTHTHLAGATRRRTAPGVRSCV